MEYKRLDKWRERAELKGLLDLAQKPEELYYRGRWRKTLFDHGVAIVGSRRMSQYGRRVIELIVPKLALEGKTIISGFMYGVDQYAHRVALASGGKTIAVLGWGIKERLEASDEQLARDIIKAGGSVLSEWEEQRAMLWTFPLRNRIVTALSKEVIVVEAALKSGSLITAAWAEKLGRKLWAVPGPINSQVSQGTNQLIATGQAEMWLDHSYQPQLSQTKDPLILKVREEAMTASELARVLKQPVAEVGAQLSLLALKGEVVEREGKYYAS
ncbi:hypothetical protein A2W24_02600 [Microgenomates group bacterium RBG_16_45_19]|nr:MAG: hypothetical protein A2W24_02600 [Microgenomates group bacterium RBG_16_45_19]